MNAFISPSRPLPDHDTVGSIRGHAGAQSFKLKRTGRTAVEFDGWQLVEAIGPSRGKQVWHDLNIYRTEQDLIVVELIARAGLPDQHDTYHVNTFQDLAEGASWLEAYNASDDAVIPAGLNVTDTVLHLAILQAVQLRHQMDRIDNDYRTMLSDVFMALDLVEPADISGKDGSQSTPLILSTP
jgi:hypothetical protein